MKIAMITFPRDMKFPNENPHHWWTPPEFVLEYWTGSCKIEFISDQDYDRKKILIQDSITKRLELINDLKLLSSRIFNSGSEITFESKKRITIFKK